MLYLVVRDAAVNLGRLGGVDDDEGQLDGRVGRGRAALHLLPLLVPLDEVLEGDLLKKIKIGIETIDTWLGVILIGLPHRQGEEGSPKADDFTDRLCEGVQRIPFLADVIYAPQ